MAAIKILFAILAAMIAGLIYFLIKPTHLDPIKPLGEKWWGEGERKEEGGDVVPFEIKFRQQKYTELLEKLENTRYFESLEDVDWKYGTRPDFMKSVVDHWINNFSWKDQVDYINRFKQFKTNIDGISLHFIHVRPSNIQPNTNFLPLMLIHGWPGSFFEFHKAIPKLIAERDGIAFELVIPSLPGYGYSSAPRKVGMSPEYIAVVMKKLMLRLGHNKFYIQGGDWGSEVSRMIARLFPEHVKGMHVNMWSLFTNPKYPVLTHLLGAVAPSLVLPDRTERDRFFPISTPLKVLLESTGYFHLQATRPDTLGFALNDSPAGLAAYVLEKFVRGFGGTSCQKEDALKCIESRVSLDELLTNIMIYWDTNSMPSALRLYKEAVNSENRMLQSYPVSVPAGFASFPQEFISPPRSWVEASCTNLVSFTLMKKGGHFAAFEEPDAFTEDVRNFITKVEAVSA